MGLTWRDTLEGFFCPKLVFLKVIKVRTYIFNFFSLFVPFKRIPLGLKGIKQKLFTKLISCKSNLENVLFWTKMSLKV